jgi:hypothetical protein
LRLPPTRRATSSVSASSWKCPGRPSRRQSKPLRRRATERTPTCENRGTMRPCTES